VIVEEARKANIPVAAHNVTLADAKELMRLGVEGWLHPLVRGGEEPDDEFIAMIKDRKAKNNIRNCSSKAGWRWDLHQWRRSSLPHGTGPKSRK
jgi:imidazolonepropionase-like amidohydrolase